MQTRRTRWGAWRYNHNNLTLEIDSRISGNAENDPYYVDLEECNSSHQVLDWLCQLLAKPWCPVEQVGYLLQAIDDLAGGVQNNILSGGGDLHFDMAKHLKSTGA